MVKVFIGVDPHRLSATIEVVDQGEMVLATGRFATDRDGYAACVNAWPHGLIGSGSRAATGPVGRWRNGWGCGRLTSSSRALVHQWLPDG